MSWVYINTVDLDTAQAQASFERNFIRHLSKQTEQPRFVLLLHQQSDISPRWVHYLPLSRVGGRLKRLMEFAKHQFRLYRCLRTLHREEAISAIYYRLSALSFGPVLFARRYGIPLTARVGPGHHDLLFYYPLPRWLHSAVKSYFRWTFRRIDRFIVVTKRIRQTLVKEYRIAPECIHVIPNPANIAAFSEKIQRSVEDMVFTFGYVGSLHAGQGVHTVIEAFASLKNFKKLPPDLRLLLIGDGPDRARLEQMVNDAGLAGRVHFVGRVPQNELPEWYAQIDVALAPYTHEFNRVKGSSALKISEYLWFDLPILAADIDDYQFIREQNFGWLYRLEDSADLAAQLLRFYQHPPDTIHGSDYVTRYLSPEVVFARYKKIILPEV